MRHIPLSLALYDIQDDMRTILRTIVPTSIRSSGSTSSSVAAHEKKLPTDLSAPFLPLPTHQEVKTTLFGPVFLDDAAIHFRCGDVLNITTPRGDYGITRFAEYKKRISPHVRSIGIVTQPFDASRNRPLDSQNTKDCKILVESLARYLGRAYPAAQINIRNDQKEGKVGETLVLAYVRLMAANQTLTSLSSFSAFPILANYGENYFERGRMLVNQWLNNVPLLLPHLHQINGDLLRNHRIMKENSMEFNLQWLNLY
mmetsp:Transcript_20776/g.35406  ORF Transcript_20776/g.35406 Transcript_20776/m.35406 type:complete len:257 (+) Transcript_20776:1615-2385(+)